MNATSVLWNDVLFDFDGGFAAFGVTHSIIERET